MRQYYDKIGRRLVFVGDQASLDYWEGVWEEQDLETMFRGSDHPEVLTSTQAYLPAGATVLEGGCGTGRYVYALREAGYRAVGVDFVARTLRRVHQAVPELELIVGDVFHLPLDEQTVDGCWSLGVIEHFWDGYEPILAEMRRVLRPGGVLFLAYPYCSPLRSWKAAFGCYERLDGTAEPPGFYQFALNPREVRRQCERFGLTLLAARPMSGLGGLTAESPKLKEVSRSLRARPWLRSLLRGPKRVAEHLLQPLTAHSLLQIYRAG